MIFGNVNQENTFGTLEADVKKCIEYVNTHDLSAYEAGSHVIEGDNFFVNIVEYETTTSENRIWEAHRKYLDVHVMLQGEEQIDLNFIHNLAQKEFVEKDDFLPLEGEKNSHAILRTGDFLVCYPGDGHRTAVQVDKSCKVKKAIFKVMI